MFLPPPTSPASSCSPWAFPPCSSSATASASSRTSFSSSGASSPSRCAAAMRELRLRPPSIVCRRASFSAASALEVPASAAGDCAVPSFPSCPEVPTFASSSCLLSRSRCSFRSFHESFPTATGVTLGAVALVRRCVSRMQRPFFASFGKLYHRRSPSSVRGDETTADVRAEGRGSGSASRLEPPFNEHAYYWGSSPK